MHFFKAQYNEYYNSLSGETQSLRTAVVGMQDTITEVNNQFRSVSLLLGEMKGDFSIVFSNGLSSIMSQLNSMKKIVEDSLNRVISTMSSLGGKLSELKPKDELYEETKEKYDNELSIHVEQYEIDDLGKKHETDEYKNWKNNLTILKEQLEELVEICEKLQSSCDKDIGLIQKFNNSVMNLRISLAAVASSLGSATISDVKEMTLQEKQEYLESIVDTITEKYNGYKKIYEYYTNDYIFENCSSLEAGMFGKVFEEVVGVAISDKINKDLHSKNGVTRGNAIVDIISYLTNKDMGINGKNILTIIEDYSNGASWTESGMDELYRKNCLGIVGELFEYGENPEDVFWSRLTNIDSERNPEYLQSFEKVFGVLSDSNNNFVENYNEALNSAMIIKGVKGLKDFLIYDYTYKNADLMNYSPNDDLLYSYGFGANDLTLEERKMISYFIESGEVESAYNYYDLRQDVINRRNGILAAENYYNSLHSGENVGVDAVCDHLRVSAKGFTNGIETFTDGLIDLVAPQRIMSEGDYETMYFLNMLNESSDGYDKGLLTNYNISNTVGLYTIPTVVSFVAPESCLSTVSFIASDIGNGIENAQQESYRNMMSYDSLVLEQEDYSTSLINTAIPYIGTDIPNDVAQALIGSATEVNPVLGAALDIAFDNYYKGTVLPKL